jgi:hypothetical protein
MARQRQRGKDKETYRQAGRKKERQTVAYTGIQPAKYIDR